MEISLMASGKRVHDIRPQKISLILTQRASSWSTGRKFRQGSGSAAKEPETSHAIRDGREKPALSPWLRHWGVCGLIYCYLLLWGNYITIFASPPLRTNLLISSCHERGYCAKASFTSVKSCWRSSPGYKASFTGKAKLVFNCHSVLKTCSGHVWIAFSQKVDEHNFLQIWGYWSRN